jgi:integrase
MTSTPQKPAKPYPDFPLFPHATRRWAKKIRGKLHYFGPWQDWRAALKKYQEQQDDLHAGRTPRVQGDGLIVRDVLNSFLTSKKMLVDSGELAARTFGDYKATCAAIGAAFGLTRLAVDLAADDFEKLRSRLARTLGPLALGNAIQNVRSVFKYAFDVGLLEHPARFGPAFKKPSRKVVRKARAMRGRRMFEAAELHQVLGAAGVQLRAMILLGVNCGFGNADCGNLPKSALDLEGGWVEFARPKTGVERRCPLWPETVEALRAALTAGAAPKAGAEGLVFRTKHGASWFRTNTEGAIAKEMRRLLKKIGIRRSGCNFYALRHTFETIAGESRDQVAVDHIMGHIRNDMASVYRERISDERLKAVTDHVRGWLFPPSPEGKKTAD